jgi:hypothetical protein
MRGTDVRRSALALVAALFSLLLLTPVAARAAVVSAGADGTVQASDGPTKLLLLASDRSRYHAPRLIDSDLIESAEPASATATVISRAPGSAEPVPSGSSIDSPTARAPPTDRWL